MSRRRIKFQKQDDKLVCGLCFPYAHKNVIKHGGTLVHAIVTAPFSQPIQKYAHAWVERKNKIYDWQTMEAGHGGKFNGKGWPLKTFYEVFQPEKIHKYTREEAMIEALHHHHYGPWNELKPNVLPQNDIEQLIQSVALRLSYEEQTPEEIRSFLISRGLTSDEAYLIFRAAQDLAKSWI